MIVKRGEVYFADLDPAVGSEQGGFRPVVIIQNDVRKFSDNTMEKIDFALSISVSENIHEIRSRARNQKVQILIMSCMIKLPILSGYVAASVIYLYYRKNSTRTKSEYPPRKRLKILPKSRKARYFHEQTQSQRRARGSRHRGALAELLQQLPLRAWNDQRERIQAYDREDRRKDRAVLSAQRGALTSGGWLAHPLLHTAISGISPRLLDFAPAV